MGQIHIMALEGIAGVAVNMDIGDLNVIHTDY